MYSFFGMFRVFNARVGQKKSHVCLVMRGLNVKLYISGSIRMTGLSSVCLYNICYSMNKSTYMYTSCWSILGYKRMTFVSVFVDFDRTMAGHRTTEISYFLVVCIFWIFFTLIDTKAAGELYFIYSISIFFSFKLSVLRLVILNIMLNKIQAT